jgi:hypothetical protein
MAGRADPRGAPRAPRGSHARRAAQEECDSGPALVVAGQRVHVGIAHARRTLSVEPADRTIRVYDDTGALLAEVPCITTKSITRFKVRKPEPPRRNV